MNGFPCLLAGVPGIVNHVYKMSKSSCPKLAVPNDSSSKKILHACNRLATQTSVSKSKPKHRMVSTVEFTNVSRADFVVDI